MAERVVIIGPGRMGLALGAAMIHAGAVEQLTFLGRALEPPPHPLFDADAADDDLLEAPVAYAALPRSISEGTTVLLLAVPDSALPELAHDVAGFGPAPRGCAALHLSGALSTDVLGPLHLAGYAVGSLHPLQAVADPWTAADQLIGSGFALAGEPAAINAGRRVVSALAGHALVIPPALRPVYHASAVLASNYLVTLVAASMRMLGEAGVPEDDTLPALMPLIRGTLRNLEQLGPVAALTGPVSRGDADTIRLHLTRLSPDERPLYCALGLETLRLARSAGLDEDRAREIEELLAV